MKGVASSASSDALNEFIITPNQSTVSVQRSTTVQLGSSPLQLFISSIY